MIGMIDRIRLATEWPAKNVERAIGSEWKRSIAPLPSLEPLESGVRMRNGGANGDVGLIALEPMKLSTPEFSTFLRLRWVSF